MCVHERGRCIHTKLERKVLRDRFERAMCSAEVIRQKHGYEHDEGLHDYTSKGHEKKRVLNLSTRGPSHLQVLTLRTAGKPKRKEMER
jgi:hypothetical protein